jgi:regulatory protein
MKNQWQKPSKTKEPENLGKAYEYAVFLLSLHLRTVGEVIRKMSLRGYTESVIEKVIDQLKSNRYLDDQRYAEIFLENLKAYKNFGYYGIKKKFMEKKLPPELIERILREGLSTEEEIKIGKRLLKKEGYEVKERNQDDEIEYRTFGDGNQNIDKQKMANKLKSRGFRGEVIAKLLF